MKKSILVTMLLVGSMDINVHAAAPAVFTNEDILVKEAFAKADSLVKTLSLDEKVSMIRGYNKFFINGLEDRGMIPLYLSDATQGVNIRNNLPDTSVVKQLKRSTAFPAPILLSSTFSPALSYKYAKAIGEECRAGGIEVLLGPGLNLQRQSQCARNFEYFGEDPYLTSCMVEEYVKGMQSTGTAACLKHFFGNNTEFYRKRSNSIIDERTAHELYLPGFKAGIDAGAKCIMTSYNLINGEWAGQNPKVIKNLLRDELGFKWLVMTDWNSVWDLEKMIKSGQNVEMPGFYDFKISPQELIAQGRITEEEIDEMIKPIFATAYAMNFYSRPKYVPALLDKFPEHENVARKVAEEGIVLLKNKNNILPLNPAVNRKILLTGRFVTEIPRGYGAAEVIGYNNVSLIDALQSVYGKTVYYIEKPTVADLEEADIVLLSMGTRDKEAIERPFALPSEDEKFMRYVVSNNPNTIAIINSGSAIDMSAWNDGLAGLIYGWYGGQSGFEALVDIMSGKVNPSGKLPMTLEKSFKDSPAYGSLPEGAQFYKELKNEHLINIYDVNYKEGVLVGYRWYDTKDIEPLYPFGFGLSYTTFELSKIKVDSKKVSQDGMINISFEICNTGNQDGAEVVQIYVGEDQPTVVRPIKELKRFQKVYLKAGEKTTVKFSLEPSDFAFWDISSHDWKTNSGTYTIMVGTSSRNIVASQTIKVLD